ncbi:MAG: alpha/beta hydrolase, partial [bacterium]|nr:alpha/beta hydrolase [bacterium]
MRHFTFELNDGVKRKEIRFKNRFGIELAGDLYFPK